MQLILYSFTAVVRLAVDALLFLMFARAIVSWFPDVSESKVGTFLYTVTEWVITPVRQLFDKFNFNPFLPIDVPFFVTFLLLTIVSWLL